MNKDEWGRWKGNKVGYRGIHTWVQNRKYKPKTCSICHKKKNEYGNEKLVLANLSGKYKRDLNDWIYCHQSCHQKEHIKGNHKNIRFKKFINQEKNRQKKYSNSRKIYIRKYYKKNKKAIQIQHKNYYQKHKKEIKIKSKIFRQKHKKEIAIRDRIYYQKYKKEILLRIKNKNKKKSMLQ